MRISHLLKNEDITPNKNEAITPINKLVISHRLKMRLPHLFKNEDITSLKENQDITPIKNWG